MKASYLTTGIVMALLGTVGLAFQPWTFEGLNTAFFSAFFPAVLAGLIALYLNTKKARDYVQQ